MDIKEKLEELLTDNLLRIGKLPKCDNPLQYTSDEIVERIADHLISHGVTVQEIGYVVTKTDRWATYHHHCSICDEELEWRAYPNFCSNCGSILKPQPPKGEDNDEC